MSFGQLTISTHSGLIQFTSGSVLLDDKEVHKTTTNSLEMKNGSVLRTEKDGNAEVLLTPGVFLRIAPDTSVRMDANSLSDTRVALLSGSAMVECDELLKGNSVAFTIADKQIEFQKNGLFRLEANPPAIAAIKGEAYVAGDVNMTVKKGKLLQLDSAVPQLSKLHLNKKNDELYQFSDAAFSGQRLCYRRNCQQPVLFGLQLQRRHVERLVLHEAGRHVFLSAV